MGKDLDAELANMVERLNDEARGEFNSLGEAERLAASSPPPKTRVDGSLQGSEYKRPPKALTDSQQAFTDAVIRGKGLRSAYREAYPNDTSNDSTVSTAAYQLARHPRIAKLLEDAAEQTIDYMIDDSDAGRRWVMRQLMISATASKQEGSRLKALELVGRSLGMFQPQQVAAPETMSAAQLKQELDKHLTMLVDVTPKRRGTGIPVESSPVESTGAAIADGVNADGQDGDPTTPPAPQMDAT